MKFKKFASVFFLIGVFITLILFINVISNNTTKLPEKSDAILVLGHSLEDGKVPGKWLVKRLETSLFLYNNDYAQKIIVSGGKGPTDEIPVAISMRDWLVENYVPIDNIYIEEGSKNTYENFKFSKQIATNNNIESIIVVSNDFHMYRSILVAKDFFDNVNAYSYNLDFSVSKLLAYIKEPLSIVKYYLTKGSDNLFNNKIHAH